MDSLLKKSKKLVDSLITIPSSSLTLNTRIIIDGKINLWCGSVVNDDLLTKANIALHLSVHPSAGYALLNSRKGKVWDQEERTSRGHLKWPKLPLLLPIKSGLQIGMSILIDGRILGNRFDLSFYQGSNPYDDPNANVPFHMEVYMDSKTIVRNSNEKKQWQQPEKELTHFPFFGHSAFRMLIRVESNRFQTIVGGRYIFDFYHRIGAISTIDHLCLHGNVEIHSLMITVPPL
ncbi:Galectin-like protein 3 [Sarcoptes scabiei]|uniref:Galectin-like protein 3 n=1 Tax=Sarcoptes scabiei TaxID=52283 RepID=A0A132A4S8_SARSC|nr:Galectin-like protein 3 [Sarcoptes scabiei]